MATVLYVDDEPAIRRLVRRWFQRRGVTVITAASADEARQLFIDHDDVAGAFIDVWLGRETGFALYAWIAQHRPQLKERVAFITGDIDAGASSQGTQFHALGRAVIAKPFELEDLEVYVRRWNGTSMPIGDRVAESPL